MALTLRRYGRCPVMIAALFLAGLLTQLQAAVIQGRVTARDNGQGLAGASVLIQRSGLGVSTDPTGSFTLTPVAAGQWEVAVSYLGYESDRRKVSVSAPDTLTLNFRLSPKVIRLDEMVFTGTRTLELFKNVPVATELVRREEIERCAAVTAADALQSEIGLDVQEDFSGQGVTLQGVDPDKVLILVDGNRVIGRVNGSIDLDQISAAGIKQIEVVKGAASTLYGSEAIGGVINIITEPAVAPLTVSLEFDGGGYLPNTSRSNQLGFRSSNGGGSANLGLKRGRTGARGSFGFHHNGLIDIDPTTNHTEGVDASDRFNGDLRLDYDLKGPADLIFTAHNMEEQKKWVEDAGLESVSVSYDDRETNRSSNASAELVCNTTTANRYSVKLYFTDNHHDWSKRSRPYGRVIDFSRGDESYGELSLLLTHRLNPEHLLTLGCDGFSWSITARSEMGKIPSVYSSDLNAGDAYLQDEWQPSPRWTLLPGVRWERHKVYGDHWSPRLSAMWVPWDEIKLRASAGFGYRAPSAKELYFTFNHLSAGYVVYGNPDLKPEESENYSISIEHSHRNSAVARLTFFYNDLRNLIDFDSLSASDQYYTGIYRYGNIASAWTSGMELEREFRIGSQLEAKLAYGFLATRNRVTGDMLIGRPRHSGRWSLSWHDGDWSAMLWGRYTDRMLYQSIFQTDDQRSDEWTQPYSLWNLSLMRELPRGFSAYIKVENILDYTHPRYGPRSGRVATLGVRWKLQC